MNSTHGGNASEQADKGPVAFLLGIIVVGILTLVLAAFLLGKPAGTNPFDAPPAAGEPAAPDR